MVTRVLFPKFIALCKTRETKKRVKSDDDQHCYCILSGININFKKLKFKTY